MRYSLVEGKIMTWNYRVFELKDQDDMPYFEIREVYYEGDKFIGYVAESATPLGETMDELRDDLGDFLKALEAPILNEADFPKNWVGSSDE